MEETAIQPLPKVKEIVIQSPITTVPNVQPQFQKISLPADPRVQMGPPYVPVSKPYYNLDRTQMFFNMPTPKQRYSPRPVGQPRLLRHPTGHSFQHGTNFRQYAVQHLQAEQMFAIPNCNHVYNT